MCVRTMSGSPHRAAGHRARICAEPGSRGAARSVEGWCNAADDLPIPRLVALLARAAGLITVDSGPAHAAAAVGCPLVVLFGKASAVAVSALGHGGRGREGAVRPNRRRSRICWESRRAA